MRGLIEIGNSPVTSGYHLKVISLPLSDDKYYGHYGPLIRILKRICKLGRVNIWIDALCYHITCLTEPRNGHLE